MIQTGSTRFEFELKKRIAEEVERLREIIEVGDAIKDYAQYQNYVGRLKALRLATSDYCDEVQTRLNEA